jgi:DNA polymerase elongation subunit (family B)
MAPETIIGQLRPTLTEQYMYDKGQKLAREKKKNRKVAEDQEVEGEDGPILWEGLFGTLEYNAVMNQERETMITIDWERGSHQQFSAAEIHKIIFDSGKPWMLSANGTIFTYEQEGVIPGLLTRWYSERKDIQKQLKEAKTKEEAEFYDKRQLVRKILLNSAYGALLNQHCRFYDKRIGQSTTLTGRQIVKHMSATLNELIAGEYNHTGEAIVYGDSVTSDTVIRTDEGSKTIEEMFYECLNHSIVGEKEYGLFNSSKVLGFNSYHMEPTIANISYIMRHKTKKKLYRITTENGKQVTVTEDHSLIVDRDGFLIECKPNDLLENDAIITFF